MSEYELNLLRQRGLAARDSKAKRGELRFSLPPGYCWNDVDQIEVDPDERVSETIKLMFRKFRELGSARQLFLWARDAGIKIPVVRQNAKHQKLVWQAPAYHNLVEMMQNPIYAGAYAFGTPDTPGSGRGRSAEKDDRAPEADACLECADPG